MKRINAGYRFVNASYFTVIFSIIGATSLFLANLGIENSYIGILVAVANIISIFFQPLFGRIADQSKKVTVQAILYAGTALLVALSFVMSLLGILLPTGTIIVPQAVLFTLAIIVVQFLCPFVNSLGMIYLDKGYQINFGVARGTGSLFYAAASYLVGFLVSLWGINVIPVFTFIMGLVILVSVKRFEKAVAAVTPEAPYEEGQELASATEAKVGFFKKYPRYILLLAGTAVVFTCHAMVSNFLYQIIVQKGGDETSFGIAAAIYALAEIPTMFLFLKINKKISTGNLLRIAVFFFVVKAFICLLASGVGLIYVAMMTQIFGYAVFIPASVYYTNKLIDKADQATGQAFMTAAIAIGNVFGSLIGGYIIDARGIHATILTAVIIGLAGSLITFFGADGKVE